jgi:hypothetical protein
MKQRLFLHIFIPLLIGGGLYLLLCPEAFVSRWFYALLGMDPPAIADGPLLRVIRNHLADMLWAWALTCSAWLVLGRCRAAAVAAICTGIFVELAQGALGVGTFDWLDIALEALTAIAAALYLAERRQTQ